MTTADQTLEEFAEELIRVENRRKYPAATLDVSNDELVEETLRLDIIREPTMKAIAALAAAFGLANERPSIDHCVAVAKALGARPEPVAACWGYLPSAAPGVRAWVDVELPSANFGLCHWDDDETVACFVIYRALGGRVACRLSQGYLQR